MWQPLSKEELQVFLAEAESKMNAADQRLWNLIKVSPHKWQEPDFGKEGFWVVAVFGSKIIWYNDIEEGFNLSTFSTFGYINEYSCDQDALEIIVSKLSDTVNN